MCRQDLFRIDGFDERYEGWGHEDADLVVRPIRAKVKRKEARFAVPVLHLWHPDIERTGLSDNVSRLEDVLKSTNTVAQEGLRRHVK